jgi:hypothetical protein
METSHCDDVIVHVCTFASYLFACSQFDPIGINGQGKGKAKLSL